MQRTRWVLVAILLLVGAVWIGQGSGLLEGTGFMVGDPFWASAGVVLVLAGVVLAVLSLRHRGA